MNKFKRYTISAGLAVSLAITAFGTSSLASSSNGDNDAPIVVNEGGSVDYDSTDLRNYDEGTEADTEILQVYKVSNGELSPISVSQYKAEVSALDTATPISTILSSLDSIVIQETPYTVTRYKESSKAKVRQGGKRVSRYLENRTKSNTSLSLSWDITKSHSYSVSLDAAEKRAVKGGVSYTWSDSASRGGAARLTVKPGRVGWWHFDPIMYKSSGTVSKTYYNGKKTSKKVTATYPKKIGGVIDGYLVAKDRKM